MSGKPYSWVDDFLPSRRRTRRYTHHEVLLTPRFLHTPVPVPAEETPCGRDPGLWFSDTAAKTKEAKRACSYCWMLSECRAYGLTHPQEDGVWGGLTRSERQSGTRGR